MKEDLKDIFTNIFNINRWNSKESKSGPGSEKIQTEQIRKELPILIKKFCIKTILDAPCGDFNWMNLLGIKNYINQYIGIDIVEKLIESNNRLYKDNKISFMYSNLVLDKLVKSDLILCRDCLVHLSLKDALLAIKNFKNSNSKYLLLTNYSNIDFNKDTYDGHWRALNFEKQPFNFPKPIYIIDENYTNDGSLPGKTIALWKINDVKI